MNSTQLGNCTATVSPARKPCRYSPTASLWALSKSCRNVNTPKFGRSRVAPLRGTLLLERLNTFGQILGREGQGELGLQVIQRRLQRQVAGCRHRPLTHCEQQR